MTIKEITRKYARKLDYVDLELLIAHSLGKTREFVLAHPEKTVTERQKTVIKKNMSERIKGKPLAYITGHKEFYGLDFLVNKNTLIPRPETELLVGSAMKEMQNTKHNMRNTFVVVDVGTGSGNIVVSIAKKLSPASCEPQAMNFFATDISKDALETAKKNAKIHGLAKKIKFLHGNLLSPAIPLITDHCSLIIVSNLPYLSGEIYSSAPVDVREYEPKSALYSQEQGLQHYRKLLEQIKKNLVACRMSRVTCFFEISPEQKVPIAKLVKNIFPETEVSFEKDLAKRWRTCKISI